MIRSPASTILSAPMRGLRRALFGNRPKETLAGLLRGFRRPAAGGGAPVGMHPFDRLYGVDTSGFHPAEELATGKWADAYIVCYWATQPSVARHCMRKIEAAERFVFLDIGCGKGRVTIIASEFPFRRVIGVEIAESLAAVARCNASCIAEHYPERVPIEILTEDATLLSLPDEPLVVFLYNPFQKPVFRRLMRRIKDSYAARPRPILILYVNPRLGRLLDEDPAFRRLCAERVPVDESEIPFKADKEEAYSIWECVGNRR